MSQEVSLARDNNSISFFFLLYFIVGIIQIGQSNCLELCMEIFIKYTMYHSPVSFGVPFWKLKIHDLWVYQVYWWTKVKPEDKCYRSWCLHTCFMNSYANEMISHGLEALNWFYWYKS